MWVQPLAFVYKLSSLCSGHQQSYDGLSQASYCRWHLPRATTAPCSSGYDMPWGRRPAVASTGQSVCPVSASLPASEKLSAVFR
mmetsp:Transcript_30398/g.74103  ORF Transcript_30398/g.74103 Transcript_30398/m.74103 type:complete len:84 (-) Transcript_30398:16-267(-)